ncbi:LiaI-LiaF-like domain-containing protein [Nanoarchaeota archaeon]
MAKNKNSKKKKSKQKITNISIGALLLITIGIIFLFGNLGIVDNAWAKLWPLLLVVIGIAKIWNSFQD